MEKLWLLENKTCNTGQVLINGKWEIVAPNTTLKLDKEPLHFTANLRKLMTFRQGQSRPGRFGRKPLEEDTEVIQASSEQENKKE